MWPTKLSRVFIKKVLPGEPVPNYAYCREVRPNNHRTNEQAQLESMLEVLDRWRTNFGPTLNTLKMWTEHIAQAELKRKCTASPGNYWLAMYFEEIEPWGGEELSP